MTLFKRKVSLPMQVLIALVLGVVIGLLLFGQTGVANYIKPFGDVFLNLIKMMRHPNCILFTCFIYFEFRGFEKIGSYGWKSILYFEIITTIAIGLGLIIGNIFKPGIGLDHLISYLKAILLNINQLRLPQNNLHTVTTLLIQS